MTPVLACRVTALQCSGKFLKRGLALCRIAGCFTLIYVCWDIKPVFYALWSPFTFLMGYNDPRKPTDDLLHGMLLPMPMLQQCRSKLSTSKQQCTSVGCGLADS